MKSIDWTLWGWSNRSPKLEPAVPKAFSRNYGFYNNYAFDKGFLAYWKQHWIFATQIKNASLIKSLKIYPHQNLLVEIDDEEMSWHEYYFGTGDIMYFRIFFCLGPLAETESENEFRPLDDRIDEFHPKATRTLFIGNLEKTTTYGDLRNIFERFGEIVVCTLKGWSMSRRHGFLWTCDLKWYSLPCYI